MDGAPSFALVSENHSDIKLTKNFYLLIHYIGKPSILVFAVIFFHASNSTPLCVFLDLRFRLVTLLTIFLLYWIFLVFFTQVLADTDAVVSL